jgi:hypothetical protein
MPRTTQNIRKRTVEHFVPIRNFKRSEALESVTNVPFLPNEIIMIISSYLDADDVGNFRLVCRAFDEIASPRFFHEVVVYFHHESLLRLQELCNNSVKHLHVRTLHFEVDLLEEPAISYEEFVSTIEESRRINALLMKFSPPHRDKFYKESLTRSKLKNPTTCIEVPLDF